MFATGQLGASVILVVTIAASLLGLYVTPALIERSLFRPYWLVRRRQYDTLYMSGFVHADLGHLFMNMVTFYFFAFPLEARLGTPSFLLLYGFGLVFSHACTYFRHSRNPDYATLGASGAVSAVLFAFIVYYPMRSIYLFLIPVPIPAVLFAVGYMLYTYWAARGARGRINHDAHLCGALTGLAYVLVIDPDAYVRLFERL